jgi:hypothetical protein
LSFSDGLKQIKSIILSKEGDRKVKDFNIGMSLYLVAETIYQNDFEGKNKTIALIDLIHGIKKLSK